MARPASRKFYCKRRLKYEKYASKSRHPSRARSIGSMNGVRREGDTGGPVAGNGAELKIEPQPFRVLNHPDGYLEGTAPVEGREEGAMAEAGRHVRSDRSMGQFERVGLLAWPTAKSGRPSACRQVLATRLVVPESRLELLQRLRGIGPGHPAALPMGAFGVNPIGRTCRTSPYRTSLIGAMGTAHTKDLLAGLGSPPHWAAS